MTASPLVTTRGSSSTHDAGTRTWALNTGCVTVYLVAAIALFWPASPWSATTLPSGLYGRGFGDPAQMTWFLEWVPYALGHGLNLFQTNFLDYPHGVDLANGTSVPLLGLVAAPVTLTVGPVAAFNVLLRLAFASSATSMFFVLRTRCHRWAAFVGGLLYGFGPYMIAQAQNHLNLVFVPLPPVIVWCIYELLAVRRRSPARVGALLGALAGAQFLINPELLTLLGVVVALGVVGYLVVQRSEWRAVLLALRRAAAHAVVVFLALSGYVLYYMLFAPGHLIGPVYAPASLQQYRANLLGPVVPTSLQFVAPLSLVVTAFRFVAGNFSENASYLSAPLVGLMLFFTWRYRRDRVIFVSALLALVAFVLSLGPQLTVNGDVTSVPLPEGLFVHLPFLDNTVPARFAFVVALFCSVVVALGGERFVTQLRTSAVRSRSARLGEMGVVALVISAAVLLLPVVPLATAAPPWTNSAVASLSYIPRGASVLTYPFTISPWTEAMSWQAVTDMRFRLVGGYVTAQVNATSGDSHPPLLKPVVVQEFLTASQFGSVARRGPQYMYPAPPPTANVRRGLCTFLHRYHVAAVLFWKGGLYQGVHPARVKRLFIETLGPPSHRSRDGTVLIWLTARRACEP